MNLWSGILNGLGEIWGHKLRSLLTMFCVLLGVMSLVVTTGFVEGMFANWSGTLAERGGLEKVSGVPATPSARQAAYAGISPGFTLEDEEAVRRYLPTARHVAPELDHSTTLERLGRTHRVRVQGVRQDSLVINRYEVQEGRGLADLDLRERTNVIILGSQVVEQLYGAEDEVLGSWVTLDGQPFEVIGVLRHYALMYGEYNTLRWKNNIAFIPLTTMQGKVRRTVQLSYLNVEISSITRLSETVDTMTNLLAHRHRGIQDFEVRTSEAELASFAQTRQSFIFFAGAIAGVSLLVSGIGIMNLMLASINERVREIGIRKALGASGRNIFTQFVAEAVTLSVLGGALGVVVASGLIDFLQKVLPPGNAPLLSAGSFVIGFGFSVVMGMLAGLYPALQAAKLDPIEALRYE